MRSVMATRDEPASDVILLTIHTTTHTLVKTIKNQPDCYSPEPGKLYTREVIVNMYINCKMETQTKALHRSLIYFIYLQHWSPLFS